MPKGALHIHSTYSDGEFTLAELREIFLAAGCSFLCMSDHADHLDEAKLQSYLSECDALSGPEFTFVAGLEYSCENRMHILGYGARTRTSSSDPEKVIRHIHDQGAIPVIAHPKNEFFPWIEEFDTLPQGIETWNSKYDGQYAPRPGTFALLQRLQQRQPGMHAFFGQDLHWKKQFRELFVRVDCPSNIPSNRPQSILLALSAGAFRGQKDEWELPSSGAISAEMVAEFEALQAKSQRIRGFMANAKRMLDRVGFKLPDSIKAHLRRIF
jgi:predicted metal-dependent phosphoesterase TrpH